MKIGCVKKTKKITHLLFGMGKKMKKLPKGLCEWVIWKNQKNVRFFDTFFTGEEAVTFFEKK